MRIIKDGPYGKTVYIDTGYVETNEAMVSNHVFMGNTRVASIVKHKDESQPATYYYATDHLGSSSVLTNQAGSYHEHIEYLPYGEVWVEDRADNEGYTTPYKFTGKELDKETNLYYFGARYYDARISRWISTDPALEKYFPKPNDYDTEHDFYWYILNDASGKLPGMGGVFNVLNLDMYHYAGNNPVKLIDPNGNQSIDPEIFKQLIMSDPLIQLVKGMFEGTPEAKYAVKMGTIEMGIKAGDKLSDIGTGLIIFGAIDGNPAIVIAGGTIDTVGDFTKLSFIIIKATNTQSSNDIKNAMLESTKFFSSKITSKIAKNIIEKNTYLKGYWNNFLKMFFSDKSELNEIDKKAGEQILNKIIGEGNNFIIDKVYKKNDEKNYDN